MPDCVEVPDWEAPQGVLSVSVESTAYYAVQLPKRGVNAQTRILCALHGWGQNSRSFMRRFACLQEENILVVVPQAPNQFYLDMASRKVGFSWLTVYDRNRAMEDVYGLLDTVLQAVKAQYGVSHPPVILGFSQGCSIAYRYHFLGKRPVDGIIACGGDLPKDVRTRLSEHTRVGILLVHGKDDSIVPLSKGEEAETILRDCGYDPVVFRFEGGHEIPEAAARYVGKWASGGKTDVP